MRTVIGLATFCLTILAAHHASAAEPVTEEPLSIDIPRGVDRPHTLAQLGVGF